MENKLPCNRKYRLIPNSYVPVMLRPRKRQSDQLRPLNYRTMEVVVVEEGVKKQDIVADILNERIRRRLDESFYVLDLDDVLEKINQWKRCMPRVGLFYAVKCNSSAAILRVVAAAGCGFDVASKSEMQKALSTGVPSSRLVYSNTCKAASHLVHARRHALRLTVFDSEDELRKLHRLFPGAQVMVRLRYGDPAAAIPMSGRFGVDTATARRLLGVAWQLGLEVVGVAFHVGCGSSDPAAYVQAVAESRKVFDMRGEVGKPMRVLDIGGGFPGVLSKVAMSFPEFCAPINKALDEHFPPESGVEIMAEPGQYLVTTAQSLFTSVIGVKSEADGQEQDTYILSDGLYGACRDIATFHLQPTIRVHPAHPPASEPKKVKVTLCGPTCDSLDKLVSDFSMPEAHTGDWLELRNMGAYTNELASGFNGFPQPKTVVLVSKGHLSLIPT
ncbi:LOW QUALITY PROTEIN: ornithine decarboxylase-like [Paramacrobiotus metropolitanus]|uniref:LOW QUALITY PROTEIN: ornithine decarboxylase-like n=1 Tax=Paramacrobiotus metropolitanus TaxID=2943436 RepID=UPI00244597BF|nr:LOW QUALITY PROTEIN: ornithine decarboxylase-like [Paramacrobiotus metropolitanus]